jgi:hypothetical protein
MEKFTVCGGMIACLHTGKKSSCNNYMCERIAFCLLTADSLSSGSVADPIAKFFVPDWRDKVDSGRGLS